MRTQEININMPGKYFKIPKNILLALIILIAVLLRFWNLSSAPSSLNWDEVSHGYNAYSILRTGKDEWGKFFPIIFRAFGDYKLPLYIYLTSVAEALFGLTPFAVRTVSALAGAGTVIVSYFLVKELFKKTKFKDSGIELFTAFLVATEPWSFFLSRGAFEANLALFLFVSGMYFFIVFLRNPTTRNSLLTFVLFGLTVWTYNSYRIFTPLMLSALVLIYRREILKINKKTLISCLFVILLFILPMFLQLLTSVGQARYSRVEILDTGTIAKIEQMRNLGGNRLIHNRYVYFTAVFIKNYFSHFTPEFLFFKGGSNYQFSIPGRGIIYLVNLPFFYLGLFFLLRKIWLFKNVADQRGQKYYLLLSWLLFSPVPSSLTREAPHVLRDITFLPLPMLFTAIGWYMVSRYFSKNINIRRAFSAVYIVALLLFVFNYLNDYYTKYRINYSGSWQYGYENMGRFVQSNYSKYDKILITKKYGEPHEFMLFNLKWDPENYRTDKNLIRFSKSDWYWVDRFDKFYFLNDWEISQKNGTDLPRSLTDKDNFKLEHGEVVNCHGTDGKCLLITSPGNYPDGWKKISVISFLDGKPAFELYEN